MSTEIGHKYLYLREDIHPPVCNRDTSEIDYRNQVTSWYQGLDPERIILHTLLTGQVFGLLGVSSLYQIQSIIEQPELKQAASDRLMTQLSLVHGVRSLDEMKKKCQQYSTYADTTRDRLQEALSYPGSINLEMVNEIRAKSDPTDLLLIALDGQWTPKARWDAKVKLQCMGLSASIDRRRREIGIEDQFERFVDWMHERIWNPDLLHSESNGEYLVSTHNPQTWACTATQWVNEKEGTKLRIGPFQKKTHLPRRSFKAETGRDVDVYVTVRDKPWENKIEKMLRKRAEDPTIAVDDDTGLLAVFNDIRDIRQFIRHLTDQGYQSNYPIIIENISYTLNGGNYDGKLGSSPKTRMMKFFVRLANEMRIEFIVHTPDTYAESLYMRDVAHQEYRVNRLFESGVPELVFPPKYFKNFDINESRRHGIRRTRAEIEGVNSSMGLS